MRRLVLASSARVEAAVFALLAIVLILRYPVHAALSPPFLMDFEIYRTAGERILGGGAAQLYEPMHSIRQVFKYAPAWALLWAPFGWLPSPVGAVLWTAASTAWLLGTLALCARLCRWLGLHAHPLTGLLALSFLLRPLGEEMGNGQVNLLWGLLVVGFVAAAVRGRPWVSACALAAAILLKLPTLIFLPYLLLRRDWRALVRALGVTALAAGLSCLLLEPRNPVHLLVGWFRALFNDRFAYTFVISNQSCFALLARFLTDDGYGLNVLSLPTAAALWLGAGLLLAGVGWLGLTARRAAHRPEGFVYDCAFLTVMMVLFSPICWPATFTALLFPAFFAVASVADQLAHQRQTGLTWMLAAFPLALSLFLHHNTWRLLGLRSWRGEDYVFLVFMVLPWLALALAGLLAQGRWQASTAPASAAGTSRSSTTGSAPPSTR